MPVFFGEFRHSLDAKGRVILPAKFRDRLADGGYITKRLDGCLAVFTAEEFEKVAQELQEKARRGQAERNVVRSFAAGTAEFQPDRQGRIVIPANLISFAGLQHEVVITGQLGSIEIWDADKWDEVNQRGEELLAAAQPGLDDIGI